METAFRSTPTAPHPPPRYNLRTSFGNLNSVATIIVGSASSKGHSPTTYTIHKDLLTSASPFFAAALNSTFAEGLDQTVRLPEEKPEIFEWFLWWLYTGALAIPYSPGCAHEPQQQQHERQTTLQRLSNAGLASPVAQQYHARHGTYHPLLTHITHSDGDLRNVHGSPKYFLLLDLYALSDKLLTSRLSNHILDTMARLSELTNSVPTPSDTWILYDGIRDSAPMRRLALDLFAYKKTDKLLEGHKDDWHPRFLRDLVVKLKRPGPESLDRHTLVPWRPASWQATKACEACRDLLKPGVAADRCEVCERAFCAACCRGGRALVAAGLGGEVGACKPWLNGMCARYHEHYDDCGAGREGGGSCGTGCGRG